MSETVQDDIWMRRAQEAYESSTSYVENNYRDQWATNLRMFHSKHATGSKYHSDAYKYRSKGFRPKTRSVVRNNEAAASAAFFSNADVVNIEPFNYKNPVQKLSAEIRMELLNYRLQAPTNEGGIPWYQILIGGFQDAQIHGVVCSKQYWKYEKKKVKAPVRDGYGSIVLDQNGKEVHESQGVVVTDKPEIELFPIENIRIAPSASWIDPVNTSPYIVALTPMHVTHVKDKIASGEWHEVDKKDWAAARENQQDTTRIERDKGKEDPKQETHAKELKDYDIVWVHENIIEVQGQDYHFYSLGTVCRLTDPVPLEEAYFHGQRPFVIGCLVMEAHRVFPSGIVELGQDLQKEANEISNSRRDNVKLVLNKRYFAKRGQQVDINSLLINAAGSVTMMNDPKSDVVPVDFQDVTSSSYAEQDRINVDYDELVGSFSSGSVQTNRKLNETVGGMAMMRNGAATLTQYMIQTGAETWIEKVLRQLDSLEQYYETDQVLLQEISEKMQLQEKYGITQITNRLLMQRATVTVNVLNSATDPLVRMDQLLTAVHKYAEITQIAPPDMDTKEIAKEIFARLGYRDGRRFFTEENDMPKLQQMAQQMQQMQEALQGKEMEAQANAQAQQQATMQIEGAKIEAENQRVMMKIQADQEKTQMQMQANQQIEQMRLNASIEQAVFADHAKKIIAELQAQTQINIAEMKRQTDQQKLIADHMQTSAMQDRDAVQKIMEQEKIEVQQDVIGRIDDVSAVVADEQAKRAAAQKMVLEYLRSKGNPELTALVDQVANVAG